MPRIAVVQYGPVYLDLDASLIQLQRLLGEAAQQGADIVCFGETWLTGYPSFLDHVPGLALWDHPPMKAVFARMVEQALRIPSPAFGELRRLVREASVAVVLGVNEASHTGTLYNSLLILDAQGDLRVHHRKLMPTYTEKLVYGLGDGHGLQSVALAGIHVGGLICWEHWMPPARQAMHQQQEDLHVALWPTVHDMHQVASRHYAFEGRCFVAAVGQLLRVRELPPELDLPAQLATQPDHLLLRGGSCIIGPDGHYLVSPVYDVETILYADVDVRQILGERMTLDVAGHYSRPDVFDLQVNRRRPSAEAPPVN